MEIPKIPTDNLYKFMALSGIAILILSLVPMTHRYKLSLEAIRLSGEIEAFNAEAQWLRADVKTTTEERKQLGDELNILNNELQTILNNIETLKKQPITKRQELIREKALKNEELKRKVLKIGEASDKQELTLRKQKLTLIEIATKQREHEYIYDMIKMEIILSIIGIVLGAGLAIWGFELWHERLQVPLDKSLKSTRDSIAKGDHEGNSAPHP